jgi:hypothetical protein
VESGNFGRARLQPEFLRRSQGASQRRFWMGQGGSDHSILGGHMDPTLGEQVLMRTPSPLRRRLIGRGDHDEIVVLRSGGGASMHVRAKVVGRKGDRVRAVAWTRRGSVGAADVPQCRSAKIA